MKKMFKLLTVGILALGLMGVDSFAKGSSGGSRSGGGFSRSSSSYSKSSSSTYTKSTKPSTGTISSKPKATAPSVKKSGGGFGATKIDTKSESYKKTNAMITKDFGISNKKYSSMKEAKADLSTKMASKTYTYKDSTTAMANRPSYIPPSYNGHTTVYVNGRYGYYDPMGTFLMYTAANMIITDGMMHSYAPMAYQTYATPYNRFGTVMAGVIGIIFLLLVLMFIIGIIRS